MRAFAKVKSSAMMARQPSVPNLMGASVTAGLESDWTCWGMLQEVYAMAELGQEPYWHLYPHSWRNCSWYLYSRSFLRCSSSHFTILPTSWERLRGQISRASGVSTTTRSRTPMTPTNLSGLQMKLPCASMAWLGLAMTLPSGDLVDCS